MKLRCNCPVGTGELVLKACTGSQPVLFNLDWTGWEREPDGGYRRAELQPPINPAFWPFWFLASQPWNQKTLTSWKESYDKPRKHIQKQRHQFVNKGSYSQSYGFSSSHVRMWELDHKEGWELKNWCFQIVVLEKTTYSVIHILILVSMFPQTPLLSRLPHDTEQSSLWYIQ